MHAHELEPIPASVQRGPVDRERLDPDPVQLRALEGRRLDGLPHSTVIHLQRVVGNAGVQALLDEEQPSPVHDVVGSGGGSPLDTDTRGLMEGRLAQDFSDVRVHTGQKADESARSINAQAYTVGTDVVFRSGHYSPGTDTGQRVLAHELTHVVQQKAGPVAGTPAPGGIRLSDPSDPFEQAAEGAAEQAMNQPAPVAQTGVQRQGEEEEEETAQTAQALVAQRQEEEEEEQG
ncbi:MAG: hypothetical protein DLM67_14040 [Candidatus Nephthysia bennettiae]|uniref:DUF4157 domain-containing protein n=1 Tax=Candidatus Nephthysia bennettiae TaxID=3127016 RepID=A0A934K280_9BACT|nr:DUF4157 domain-containing protein [Candidatus Dormibacteraeota bacterium]MBJ7614789.1 DUF4157 domain-containing protein [Candidatus Dormibacteraeota bacterium]PZR93092.1 MAG: hypothetical protein DLM67_14040 [Candidatus Dormibacteraeota bacterium]